MSTAERVALAVSAVIGIALVAFEAPDGGFQDFWKNHALLAGLVSGGLILAPVLYVFEQAAQRREREQEQRLAERIQRENAERERLERERWKRPAVRSIATRCSAAQLADRRFVDELIRSVEQTGDPGLGREPSELITVLATGNSQAFGDLAVILHEGELEADTAAALSAVALYPPISTFVASLEEIQQTTAEMAAACEQIAGAGGNAVEDDVTRLAADVRRRQRLLADLAAAVGTELAPSPAPVLQATK